LERRKTIKIYTTILKHSTIACWETTVVQHSTWCEKKAEAKARLTRTYTL